MTVRELEHYTSERRQEAIASLAGKYIFGMKLLLQNHRHNRDNKQYEYKRLSAYISKKGKPVYIKLDDCYDIDEASNLLIEKIEANEKYFWILEKFLEGVSEMELKHYGAVTRNRGAIRLKAYSKQEALVKFREKDKSIQADDIYQKIGETWDETTFDCE